MSITDDERRDQIRKARDLKLAALLKPIITSYPPEAVLQVLADGYTTMATIGPEVEVAQWILKLSQRIEARRD